LLNYYWKTSENRGFYQLFFLLTWQKYFLPWQDANLNYRSNH